MLPILVTVAGIPVSSFGLFLLLSFFVGSFLIWKLSLIYELDVEKVLDLILFTLLGGLIGARLYFVIFHLELFDEIFKLFVINRYPGLSFWGALGGGLLFLKMFSNRLGLNFWQALDFSVVGLFIGIALSSIGCLLGSCQVGVASNFLGVTQVGYIAKRFPLQIVEFILFLIFFLSLWKQVLRFHQIGQIAGKGLIILGFVKGFLEFFRGESNGLDYVWSVSLLLLGIVLYYQKTKKSFRQDLKYLISLIKNPERRKLVVSNMYRNWYTQLTNWKISLKKLI